jgi:hypothetical protein
MELLQKVLNGEHPEAILSDWKVQNSSQIPLKQLVKTCLKNLPNSKNQLIQLIPDPLFSLNLCPSLIPKLIKHNFLVQKI